MKKIYMVLILLSFACKSGEEAVVTQQKEPLLHYSKGPCLGRCPVYDFWVYHDGNFIYKKVNGIKSNREITGKLTSEKMKKLKISLKNDLGEPVLFKKVRDMPISKLRFNGKKYEYHSTKIKDGLKRTNILIEGMIAEIITGQQLGR
ncbi:DUF6438 domain-containing protein [Flagellimonas pacifica]|uniref:DUF6438 domain-containing protein n=1 Tax=Flagellimonas pacifica TaxID=1247520 RepID=A0A285ME22_9FLAO|nr:DUF6438 domain-containing protein [Allomuricauda parva]SNY95434.1 hypothetical protein SAMN06265377_1103 [Allomuricauda parva]